MPGRVEMASTPRFLVVARIVAPFGVHGEVKADLVTDYPARLASRATVYLGREDEEPRARELRGVRFHQNRALLSFVGCDDRSCAEALRGMLVQVPITEVPAPPPGAYYFHQIIGLRVEGTDGAALGTVTAILTTASNDVYVVHGEKGELLVPAVEGFVREVDIERGRMIVDEARL